MSWDYEKSSLPCGAGGSLPGAPTQHEVQRMLHQLEAQRAQCSVPMPPPQGELFTTLEEQEKETHRLDNLVDELTTRLRPVMLPDAPAPLTDGVPTRCYGSPLANIVQTNNVRIAVSCQRLESVIRLLAL